MTTRPVIRAARTGERLARRDQLAERRAIDDAEAELRKIPFFVRGKARRNTETYATERGLPLIELATLYDAKAHYGR